MKNNSIFTFGIKPHIEVLVWFKVVACASSSPATTQVGRKRCSCVETFPYIVWFVCANVPSAVEQNGQYASHVVWVVLGIASVVAFDGQHVLLPRSEQGR